MPACSLFAVQDEQRVEFVFLIPGFLQTFALWLINAIPWSMLQNNFDNSGRRYAASVSRLRSVGASELSSTLRLTCACAADSAKCALFLGLVMSLSSLFGSRKRLECHSCCTTLICRLVARSVDPGCEIHGQEQRGSLFVPWRRHRAAERAHSGQVRFRRTFSRLLALTDPGRACDSRVCLCGVRSTVVFRLGRTGDT